MKILIADDHELFRDGLVHTLDQLENGPAEIVEASSFVEALEMAELHKDIDIVLLDLAMPGMTWVEGLQWFINYYATSETAVVVLSASDDRAHVMQAVNLGASGFIPKTSSSKVMVSALQLVLSGGVYLPPAVLMASDALSNETHNNGSASFLTPRQKEVLALLGQGRSNKEIARVLTLAEGTVKLHVTAILKALQVNNRTRAVVAAAQMGLTSSIDTLVKA